MASSLVSTTASPRAPRRLRLSGWIVLRASAILFAAVCLLAACASNKPDAASNTPPKNALIYQDPCASLKAQIREKQKLDEEINTLAKKQKKYLKAGDTASAASAAHRLIGMRENQRLMKESLDQTGNSCQVSTGDPLPVRGPAAQDPARMGQ